ncbi:MAG: hypothetical protein NTX82_00390 [Candidatus Parcubacteria bacterium]|nr:hypothetical protein [Candidatus Parcubacteria bacterium]
MKKWMITQTLLVVAIIWTGWMIKVQLTSTAQAKEIPRDEIFVQLADGRLVPYHQVRIIKTEEQVNISQTDSDQPKIKVISIFRHRRDIQQRISEIEPELADTLIRLAHCESSLNPAAVGDENNSYGLYQIFLKWHPDVTLEQAQDIDFATRWTANKIRQGQGDLWSCWSKI